MAKPPALHVVTASEPVETAADRARRLLAEAKTAATENVDQLAFAMHQVIERAAEIADGGDAYPPGARDLCRRLVDEIEQRGRTLNSIMGAVR